MDNLKEKKCSIFKDKKIYIFIAITLIFFGIFCKIQYTTDTYSVFVNSLKTTILTFITSGRFVTGIIFYILMGILKLNNIAIYTISYIFAMIFMIISLYKLNKILEKYIKNEVISVLSATLIIINIFSIELFMYIEKITLVLSILMCVLSIEQLQKFFEENKKAIIWSFTFMFIANCCYQGTVGLFVVLGLILIIKHSKNIKEFIINNILVALNYAIPAVINLIVIKLFFNNNRVQGETVLAESVIKIFNGMKNMILYSYQLFPKYLFAIIVLLLIIYGVYKILNKNQKILNKILQILGIFYIVLVTIGVTVAPQLLQNTNSIWLVARSTYTYASLIGILLVYIASIAEIKNIEVKSITFIGIIFLIIQFYYFNTYSIDNYIVDYKDKQDVLQIQKQIEEYENTTGKTITKIALYKDKNPKYTYSGIHVTGDINIKALAPDWSIPYIIKYYTGKELEVIEKDEDLNKNFKGEDWDIFDTNQVILIEDTLHLCSY